MPSFAYTNEGICYHYFARVWSRCRHAFEETSDDAFALQTATGRVSLMGIRGLASWTLSGQERWESIKEGKTGVYDDSMLILVHLKGESAPKPRVEHFPASLQYGYRSLDLDESRDLRPGMHEYALGIHKRGCKEHHPLANKQETKAKNGQTIIHWLDAPSAVGKGKNYRALNPVDPIPSFKDDDRNGVFNYPDPITKMGRDRRGVPHETPLQEEGHNVHASNESEKLSGMTGTEGCQVIHTWANYLKFMRRVEADHSLKGTIRNELPAAPGGATLNRPAQDGTRNIAYTLIDTRFLFPCVLPVGGEADRNFSLAPDAEARTKAEILMTDIENNHGGGCFPLGQNGCWHTGVHLPLAATNQMVYAPMAGEIVAFRLGSGGHGRATASFQDAGGQAREIDLGNRNFILMRHILTPEAASLIQKKPYYKKDQYPATESPYFYSLYMHLGERSAPLAEEITQTRFPFPWMQQSCAVRKPFKAYGTRNLFSATKSRPTMGMLQTNTPANMVKLVRGDKYRLLARTYLIQEKQAWSRIEKYYDGATGRVLPTPLELCVKEVDHRTCSEPLAEWMNDHVMCRIAEGEVILTKSVLGKTVEVDAGAPLWQSGVGLNSDGTLDTFLHWSIFSGVNLFPEWKEVIDTTKDTLIEDPELLNWVKAEPSFSGEAIGAKAIRTFYSSSDPETHRRVATLRKTAIQCQSEWADPMGEHVAKHQKMAEMEGLKLDENQYRCCTEPFRWWDDVFPAVDESLPIDPFKATGAIGSNNQVWHYNPVQFLLEMAMIEESKGTPSG